MTAYKINPDSVMLQQMDQQWAKFFQILLFKLKGREKVTITLQDIQAAVEAIEREGLTLLNHGRQDAIDFQLIDREAAMRLAEWDRQQRGTA